MLPELWRPLTNWAAAFRSGYAFDLPEDGKPAAAVGRVDIRSFHTTVAI